MESIEKIKSAILEKVREVVDIVNELYPGVLKSRPGSFLVLEDPYEVSFKLNGKCAGKAYPSSLGSKWKLRFNLEIARRNLSNFLSRTVGHEIAHIVAGRLDSLGGRGHGRTWKSVCYKLTGQNSRCHSYDLSFLEDLGRSFTYFCPKCGKKFYISKRRHCLILKSQSSSWRRIFCDSHYVELVYLKGALSSKVAAQGVKQEVSEEYLQKNLALARKRYEESPSSRRKASIDKWQIRLEKFCLLKERRRVGLR